MKELKKEELQKVLEQNISEKIDKGEQIDIQSIEAYLGAHIEKKAILGFDIYKYSQYQNLQQILIPHLFKRLYDYTVGNCINGEKSIFKGKTAKHFTDRFIDTGDGGFQIFDNPFEALIFSMYFQANVARYNTYNFLTKDIFEIVGEINLRYSLTYGNINYYNKNYYGAAIINCARIMSRDKLNRFLVDDNTVSWFNKNFNGIENLQAIEFEDDFKKIELFKSVIDDFTSVIFRRQGKNINVIRKVDILKIGEITSKSDTISIHSLHMQYTFNIQKSDEFKKYTVSIGNLNSLGLSEF